MYPQKSLKPPFRTLVNISLTYCTLSLVNTVDWPPPCICNWVSNTITILWHQIFLLIHSSNVKYKNAECELYKNKKESRIFLEGLVFFNFHWLMISLFRLTEPKRFPVNVSKSSGTHINRHQNIRQIEPLGPEDFLS